MYRRSPWYDHRFRGSKPQLLLAEPSVFSGLAVLPVTRSNRSSGLFGLANVNSPTLSAIDAREIKASARACQCPFLVQSACICGNTEQNLGENLEGMWGQPPSAAILVWGQPPSAVRASAARLFLPTANGRQRFYLPSPVSRFSCVGPGLRPGRGERSSPLVRVPHICPPGPSLHFSENASRANVGSVLTRASALYSCETDRAPRRSVNCR